MPDTQATPQRPSLTFPADIADWVREHYNNSTTILEYGTGGSTVMASEMSGKTIFAVESDQAWSDNLDRYIKGADATRSSVQMHWVDVGPTKRWGIPQSTKHWRQYWQYPASVWQRDDFVHPDVILTDGIFRSACVMTAMMMATRKITLLFDDYMNPRDEYRSVRPRQQGVEKIIKPVEVRGRMAKFVIEPGQYQPSMFPNIIDCFFRHY